MPGAAKGRRHHGASGRLLNLTGQNLISTWWVAERRNGGAWALAGVDTSRCRGGPEGWRGRSRRKGGRGRACCGGGTKIHRGGVKRHRRNRRLCVHGGGSGISRSTRNGAECLIRMNHRLGR